jgi:uncharacterized protein (DUF1330 family)
MNDIIKSKALKAKLPGKLRAFIFNHGKGLSFDEPVYAINWFNTKTQWVYDFYNFLAVRAVNKVGGAGFFKGKRLKTLFGNENDEREVLLVVRYPSLRHFRNMMENTYFQWVSFLRILAVSDFTFGFTKREDSGPDLYPFKKSEKNKYIYAVHHFRGKPDVISQIQHLSVSKDIKLYFSGQIQARIGTGKTQNSSELVPCIMDGIVILRSHLDNHRKTDNVEVFINSSAYQSIIKQTHSSFIGLYSRVL